MLRELAVRDLALIDRLRVSFASGLTVITGETGAGKSLLIDALTLVLGGRADSTLVRHGAESARVEALFERGDEQSEPLICVREVSGAGRSVARIDDETVTAARLAAEVAPLVEIHGQHDQQRLLHATWQRDVLDAFGGHHGERLAVSRAVTTWRANDAALRELVVDPTELERRIELAEHAALEVETADVHEGEVAELRSRLALAANAERIQALVGDAHQALAGESLGARDQLARAERAVADLARLDQRHQPLAERAAGLEAEAAELALDLRRLTDTLDDAALDVALLEARLGVLYGLLRKYGDDEAAVIGYGTKARTEIDRLRGMESERARRLTEAERLEAIARHAAAALSAARSETAGRLSAAVTAGLLELGFPQASFSVDVSPTELDESGADTVTFLLAPNPGEPPRPLARIASGGEMSRVALALKVVLARADVTPTLVFDEVDAGIGGRSAEPVGRSLWQLARDHQVICITHLPQIAAQADAHLRIDKSSRDGRTVTEVRQLDESERVAELALMLGGTGADEGALAAAQELLARAATRQRVPAAPA